MRSSSVPAQPLGSLYRSARTVVAVALVALSACGGAAPPTSPTIAATRPTEKPEPPADVSAVPDPAGLMLVARISKPEAFLKTVAGWAKLPLPGVTDIVRSIADDSVADAVDLSRPIDTAIALGGTPRSPRPLVAVSVAVKSLDDATTRLSARHKVTRGKNGQFIVEGVGRSATRTKGPRDEDEEDAATCVLAPASTGARLVCGDQPALDALAAYLTRTVPRKTWASDVHVEVTLDAVRGPLTELRAALPFLARSAIGGGVSSASGQLIDAAVSEFVDVVGDTQRMTLDVQLADDGMQATFEMDYTRATSLLARLAASHPDRAGAPPPAFWHLPADTDVAAYVRGSEPTLFDRPRELLGSFALDQAEHAGMPEPERKAMRELVVDRMFPLLTGPLVYGHGYDSAAIDRAIAAAKRSDHAGKEEGERILAEQALLWHLVQVSEPITKVGPILKDWARLWNRPAFAKWARQQASAKSVAQMRIVPTPAGVVLPKDSVHLEIVMPRKAAGKPMALHILAVPDQGATWLGLGIDAKVLAQKAAVALATAPATGTLGTSQRADALREIKANGAWFVTTRSLLMRSPSGPVLLGAVPANGSASMVITFTSQAPSGPAPGGAALATVKLPRATIEDIATLWRSWL